jgi:hypothetical protein
MKDYPHRKNKKSFYGKTEDSPAPGSLTAKDILTKVNNLKVILGKGKGSKQAPSSSMLKNKSIFWDLPYWWFLDVCHALDGMHITKYVTEGLLGTLMEAKGKGKDSLNTRLDLKKLKVRPELHPELQPDRTQKLPVASWTLEIEEKKKLLSFFHELKVPTGYCSNIRRLANMKDLKFNMHLMKAHDIMTQLLPVAIRGVLPEKLRDPIIKLCSFFNTISHKVIDPATLDKLEKDMHRTMSRLEMHLPPTFFDISVHLISHLVQQIRALGLLFLHQMFPF